MIYTSLNEIASFNPCPSGWKDILRGQKKTEADDIIFPLTEVCESNTISDVCWLLGKKRKEIQVAIRFARLCADSVAHLKNVSAASASDAYADAYAYASANAAYADAAAYAISAISAASASAYAYASASASDAASASANAAASAAAYAISAHAISAYKQQEQKNKAFLIQCITEWSE